MEDAVEMDKRVIRACEAFLDAIGSNVIRPDLFIILARVAERRGFRLRADYQGNGTHIYFGKLVK